jgi:putative hemolysin
MAFPFFNEFIIIFIMLVLSAFFVAYEMALASIPRIRLVALSQQKKKGAEDALYMKDRMEMSLAVVQIGVTLVSAVAAATGGAGVQEKLVPFFSRTLMLPDGWAEFCL